MEEFLVFVENDNKIMPIFAKKISYFDCTKYIDLSDMKEHKKEKYYKIDKVKYEKKDVYDIYKFKDAKKALLSIEEYIKNVKEKSHEFINEYIFDIKNPSFDRYVEHYCIKYGKKINKNLIDSKEILNDFIYKFDNCSFNFDKKKNCNNECACDKKCRSESFSDKKDYEDEKIIKNAEELNKKMNEEECEENDCDENDCDENDDRENNEEKENDDCENNEEKENNDCEEDEATKIIDIINGLNFQNNKEKIREMNKNPLIEEKILKDENEFKKILNETIEKLNSEQKK
jgi:hypothetical protein